jgi:hypothetical protein
MTYMATCDSSTCDKFNDSTAKWFKIDQIGKKVGWDHLVPAGRQCVSSYLFLPTAQLIA